MSKSDVIELKGTVIDALPNSIFKVPQGRGLPG